MKILLCSGTETSILDLRVVHGLGGRWQRSGNVFPPSITEYHCPQNSTPHANMFIRFLAYLFVVISTCYAQICKTF